MTDNPSPYEGRTPDGFPATDGRPAEEAIRQWWSVRFSEPLPEDVKSWLRALIRDEVFRTRLKEQRLDDITLHRVYEARRLCQTRLENTAESIQRLRRQEERLHTFVALNAELTQQQEHLFQLNKQQASQLHEQRELERFEEFEAVNGRFQRINTLRRMIANTRQRQKELALEIDQAQRRADEAEQGMVAERGKSGEKQQAVTAAANVMAEAERITAMAAYSKMGFDKHAANLKMLTARKELQDKELKEKAKEAEELDKEITALKLKLQTLEVHRRMLNQSHAVQLMLDELQKVIWEKEQVAQELNLATRQQEERDEQLSRLFAESQSLNAKMASKKDEADGHRRSIAGLDSYNLQRRALELRGRKLMLETAFSLWKSIATGYDLMEQKEQTITQLRLHANHLNHDIDTLEQDLRQVNKQLELKSYHLTLSKSQNVIELRGDLAEGIPCTVCGATHHPWEGESITEQNALITTLKADCEMLRMEQANKQRQLHELQTDLIATQTRLKVEDEHLSIIRERQKKDTDEWHTFHILDRSFSDCSPSTNREARSTLINLLIERSTVDAENAEKELNAFTFHLDAIATIGIEIQKLQQQADDIAVSLNEANTACQVMAGQVERLNNKLAKVTQDYRQRYETLEHIMTIPEWFQLWKQSPESIRLRIQEMREQRDNAEELLADRQLKAAVAQACCEDLQKNISLTIADITSCEGNANSWQEQADKAGNALEKLLPGGDGKGHFAKALAQHNEQKEKLTQAELEYMERLQTLLTLQAERDNLEASILETESIIAAESRGLDIWIRQYNAANPPVQMAELERILADDKDWHDIRKKVRETQVELATTQNRLDHLRAQIIALQTEGLRPMADNGEAEQRLLQEQLLELEQQQRQYQKQLAQYDLQLQQHEQSAAQAI